MGPASLLPLPKKDCGGFLSFLKSIALAGFELANLGSFHTLSSYVLTQVGADGTERTL
jgi:hypothetical protein